MGKNLFRKALAALCAAWMLLAAAGCADEDKDGSNSTSIEQDIENTTKQLYEVGTTVTMDGAVYLVIKNTESTDVAEENPELNYYPNFRAEAYRDYLLKEYGMTRPYAVLFNTETVKENPMTTSYWDDVFMIMRGDEKYWRVRYRWERGGGKIDADLFNKTLTADELRRAYDPTTFSIENYSPAYGDDLSGKKAIDLSFNYIEQNGVKNRCVYADDCVVKIKTRKDYFMLGTSTKYPYVFADEINSKSQQHIITTLDNKEFFYLTIYNADSRSYDYRLYTKGTGEPFGSTDSSIHESYVEIKKLSYDSEEGLTISFKVRIRKDSSEIFSKEYSDYNLEDSTDSDDADVEESTNKYNDVHKYISIPEQETTTFGDIQVPATITFSVPFADEDAPLGEYTKVTFVPEEQEGSIIYVPKKGEKTPYEFIDKYEEAYLDLFNEYAR